MEYGQQAPGNRSRLRLDLYHFFDSCRREPNVMYSPETHDYKIPILNHII
jgi:hypothetical protein